MGANGGGEAAHAVPGAAPAEAGSQAAAPQEAAAVEALPAEGGLQPNGTAADEDPW